MGASGDCVVSHHFPDVSVVHRCVVGRQFVGGETERPASLRTVAPLLAELAQLQDERGRHDGACLAWSSMSENLRA
jgi:hypothetical protein